MIGLRATAFVANHAGAEPPPRCYGVSLPLRWCYGGKPRQHKACYGVTAFSAHVHVSAHASAWGQGAQLPRLSKPTIHRNTVTTPVVTTFFTVTSPKHHRNTVTKEKEKGGVKVW